MEKRQRTRILSAKLGGEGCEECLRMLKVLYCVLMLKRMARLTMIIKHVKDNPLPFTLVDVMRPFAWTIQLPCLFYVEHRVETRRDLDVNSWLF